MRHPTFILTLLALVATACCDPRKEDDSGLPEYDWALVYNSKTSWGKYYFVDIYTSRFLIDKRYFKQHFCSKPKMIYDRDTLAFITDHINNAKFYPDSMLLGRMPTLCVLLHNPVTDKTDTLTTGRYVYSYLSFNAREFHDNTLYAFLIEDLCRRDSCWHSSYLYYSAL